MAEGLTEIAAGVYWLPVKLANVYFAGEPGAPWMLVDTGMAGSAETIRAAAERLHGRDARPQSIVLTHGHGDHAGNARLLSEAWDVPVYAHALELPYLTGKSDYPPADPTAPGFLAFVSRFFEPRRPQLAGRVKALETRGIPGIPDWEWHHTPGHSPGHIALFHTTDATLLAGDAFATVNMDSLWALLTRRQRVSRPPTPFTCDWRAAADSVRKLDALAPLTFGCGHGVPMSGADAADELFAFASRFPAPQHGRYVDIPARTDENGVISLPPEPPDPAPGIVAAAGVAALAGMMVAVAAQRRQKHPVSG